MPNTLKIRVRLPANRNQAGELELIDPITGLPIFGPVPVLGRAAMNTASANGNPTADPLRPFGHTPLGEYRIDKIVSNGDGTSRPTDIYGAAGSIILDPTSGDAAAAKSNGRVGLLIHAGRQVWTPTPLPSHLRPTNGCLRMLEGDLATLTKKIDENSFLFPGVVTVEVGGSGPTATIDDAINDGDPPPLSGGTIILP